jgi:hypothetical protein
MYLRKITFQLCLPAISTGVSAEVLQHAPVLQSPTDAAAVQRLTADSAGKTPTKGFGYYFNECWTGSEYLLASLYMWQGMADKALAEVKAISERYDATKRNPWNELECGSHYSRSMSSYGVFTAACGFTYDGPRGEMGFAPRVSPEDFRAAFTAAEGFGSYSQKYDANSFDANLAMSYGTLRLKALAVNPPNGNWQTVRVEVDGKPLAAQSAMDGTALMIRFNHDVRIHAGQSIAIHLRTK